MSEELDSAFVTNSSINGLHSHDQCRENYRKSSFRRRKVIRRKSVASSYGSILEENKLSNKEIGIRRVNTTAQNLAAHSPSRTLCKCRTGFYWNDFFCIDKINFLMFAYRVICKKKRFFWDIERSSTFLVLLSNVIIIDTFRPALHTNARFCPLFTPTTSETVLKT